MVSLVHFLAEEDIAKINRCLQESLAPFLIILFGSCAKGTMRSDSDIDIAFFSEKDYDAYEVFIAAQELAALMRRDVDLVDLSRASTVMKAQIVSVGRVIHCSNEAHRMVFFMNTLKEYAVLNEHRLPVLAKIAGRGSN
jgi:predicted nucleotidyltransferase